MPPTTAGPLLTTTEASVLLGCSRQHVVDLCKRGDLTFITIGTHRRLRRADVELLLRPKLTRDQQRALWLHHVVAGRLATDPERTLAKARHNLQTMRRAHPTGSAAAWVKRWESILDGGIIGVLEVLVSTLPEAAELRQNSPFAGVLSDDERRAALEAFRSHWRREHAA